MLAWRGLGTATSYASTVESLLPQYCPSCPANLALAVMAQESGTPGQLGTGNPNAVSSAGAIGLFQLEPATAAGLNVNPNDPTQNIEGGLTYLQQMYNQFGNWQQALEAYNEGPGALQSQIAAGVTPTSTGYASGILSVAGVSDTSSNSSDLSSDLSDLGVTDSTYTSGDLTDELGSLSIGGLSGVPLAIAGVAVLGVLIWAVSR